MRLRNQILLWLLLVGLLPLLGGLWAVMRYSEHLYLHSVDEEMSSEVERVAAVLQRQISKRDDLLDTLADSTILTHFGESLFEVVKKGEVVEGFTDNLLSLQYLLVDMQPLIAEDAVIRVLDQDVRTIIKLRFGRTTHPSIETLQPYGIIEREPPAAFVRYVKGLPSGQTSHLPFPNASRDFRVAGNIPLLDAIRPVDVNGQRVYLVFSSRGESLNDLLEEMPRLRHAFFSIGSRTPPDVFYSDITAWRFGVPRAPGRYPPLLGLLRNGGVPDSDGVLVGGASRLYYTEFFPYSDELMSWVVAAEVDEGVLLDFFRPLRWGVTFIGGIAFIVGILLVTGLSRKIASPVARLARNMKNYAQGEPVRPDVPSRAQEIRDLQAAFRFMTARLETAKKEKEAAERQLSQAERLASIGEMAAGIGHELNNPLNNILSLARLVKHDGPNAETFEDDIEGLMDEARRASNIVGGVLRFARQVPPQYKSFDVCHWISQCMQRVTLEADEGRVNFEVHCKEGLWLEADPMQLEQVMVNLLVNAVHASPEGETVRVSAHSSAGYCVITVSDHGEGIPPEVEEHIYEPFFTTKEVGEGSGLGLSISLGIVSSHDGTLVLKNRDEGTGVVAVLRIPLKPPGGMLSDAGKDLKRERLQ
ncbi:MAG: sensor histidine kinase [bacterium]